MNMASIHWDIIKDLLLDTKYRNILFIGSNGSVRAHQAILSTFSYLLKSIFEDQLQCNPGKTPVIFVPDFTSQCICGMLNLLYSGETHASHGELLTIMDLLQVLQLQMNTITMEEFKYTNVSSSAVIEVDDTDLLVSKPANNLFIDDFQEQSDATSDDEPLINLMGLHDIFSSKTVQKQKRYSRKNKEFTYNKRIKREVVDIGDIADSVLQHVLKPVIVKVKKKRGRKPGSKISENRFPCELCGKIFEKKPRLERHLSSHRGEKPYSCGACGKTFREKGNLSEHLLIHTGEKHFQCEICAQLFRKKFAYLRHKVIHTGEKAHQCDICGKAFSLKQMLDAHVRIHTGERPYCCELCGKAFRQKAHLTTHMKIHTVNKDNNNAPQTANVFLTTTIDTLNGQPNNVL